MSDTTPKTVREGPAQLCSDFWSWSLLLCKLRFTFDVFHELARPRIKQLMMEMSENNTLHETMAAEHETLKKRQDCKNDTISLSQANCFVMLSEENQVFSFKVL